MARKLKVMGACGALTMILAGCSSEPSEQTTYEAQTEIADAARSLYSALAAGDIDQFNNHSCPEKALSKTPSTSRFLVKFRDLQVVNAYAANTSTNAGTSQVEVEFRYSEQREATKDVHDAKRIEGVWKIC